MLKSIKRKVGRQMSMLEVDGFIKKSQELEKLEDDFINKCGYSEEESQRAALIVLEYDKKHSHNEN